MHPQYGTTLNVDIDGSFTIEEMIKNLLESGFISENKAGHDFSLTGDILDRQATFEEITELYDGAVIRIIAHKDNSPQKVAAANYLTLHIKHPTETLILDLNIKDGAVLNDVIQQATDKRFVLGNNEILHLQKGDKLLDLNKTAQENQVTSGDYLQITQADFEIIDPIQIAVGQLDEKLQNLEKQLEIQLTKLKEALPAANMIPIDPTRAVNPTMDTYESIDTIVNRLRKKSKEAPLKPIRPFPTTLVISLCIIFVMVTLCTLKILEII
jgi:hypothetical protein